MSEPEKYLILSVSHDDYHRFIRAHRLPAGRCFQCVTMAEVRATQERNERWGIACRVMRTPEYQNGCAA